MTPFFLKGSLVYGRVKTYKAATSTLLVLLVVGLVIPAIPVATTSTVSVQSAPGYLIVGDSNTAIPAPVRRNVTIYRDSWGVPHIYADHPSDAYYALGWAMAQDRMFEMDLIRRFTAGRLSEILGSDYLSFDVGARTMGFYKIAEDTWNGVYAPDVVASPETKQNLEQFAAGVNHYTSLWPDGIPLEYQLMELMGVPPAVSLPSATQNQWKPQESLAVAGFMGWDLTDSSQQEIIRGAFASQVDPYFAALGLPGVTDFLMPTGWINMTTIMPPDCPGGGGGGGGESYEVYNGLKELSAFSNLLRASNNWVINETLSETGNAMLCNDPHLMLQTPGINWEVHIKTNDYNVVGCMIPGGPVVYTGHNDHFAFGVTNLMADILDLYYYVFDDPVNPTQYWDVDHWEPLVVTFETINVFGGAPVTLPIVSTKHGPLIDTPAGKFAFRWGGKESGYGEVTGFNLMMGATNLAEWKEACSHMCVILQNYVYADKDGNIAWCPSGRIPVRDPTGGLTGVPTFGTVPSNGSAGQNEWIVDSTGKTFWIPHSSSPATLPSPWDSIYPLPISLPYSENPKQGFIVTANNQPIYPDYQTVGPPPAAPAYPWPVWIGPAYTFDAGYRAQRITELITSMAPTISVDDMKAIQTDVVSIPARNFIPIILGAMGFPASTGNATIDAALGILATWNCSELRNLAAPLIWEVFFEKFAYNTFFDEFGPSLYPFPNMIIPLWNMTLDMALAKPNPYAIMFFDDKNTPGVPPSHPDYPLGTWEFMPDIINASLHDAIDWIASQLGPNMATWKYGDLHVVQFTHPFEESVSGFSVPPTRIGMDGGSYTVNPGGHQHKLIPPKDYLFVGGGTEGTGGASYRGIYECKEGWDTSLIVVPPGESGFIGGTIAAPAPSPHYADQFPLWLGNAYGWKPCLFDDTVIQNPGQYESKTVFYDAEPPVADAGPDKMTRVGDTVTFDASGSTDNVGIVSYEWDVGEGPLKFGKIVTHVYTTAGYKTVTLTVRDDSDHSDTDTAIATVRPPVGGIAAPINVPNLLASLSTAIALAIVSGIAITVIAIKYRKKRKQV